MNDNLSISLLEQLPNELFLEIFSYFSASDLHYSWFKLNSRIKSILRSTNLFICIAGTEDVIKQNILLTRFNRQIISLKDYRHHPHAKINLGYLINIRSLFLSGYSLEQTEMLKPIYMPQLEYLSLNYFWAPFSLFQRILFSKSERFLHLLSFKVYNVEWKNDNIPIETTINTTVKTLYYNKYKGISLNWLGYSFPNLISFKGIIQNCFECDKLPSMLQYLDISIYDDCLHIEQLIHSLSKLRYLRLQCRTHSWSFFNELASALDKSRLLKKVRLKIIINRIDFFDLEQARLMSEKWFRTFQQSVESSGWDSPYVYTPKSTLSQIKNT